MLAAAVALLILGVGGAVGVWAAGDSAVEAEAAGPVTEPAAPVVEEPGEPTAEPEAAPEPEVAVKYHLVMSKPVADVWRDGERVGMTPFTVEMREGDDPVALRLVASGYEPTEVTVAWDDDNERDVELAALERATPPRAARQRTTRRSAPARKKVTRPMPLE